MDETLKPLLPILMVDDERPWLHSLALTLERQAGLNHTLLCCNGDEALKLLASTAFSLVLLDLTLPPPTGEDIIGWIRNERPELPVIIISGINQLNSAVRCMQLGACDYFVKTDDRNRIMTGILRALRLRELETENEKLRSGILHRSLGHPEAFAEISTVNPRMQAVFHYLEAVSPSSQPVLITGDSGTGKELVARIVHRLGRPKGPWVAVNAAGLDDNVFADTLFGHVRGAFTGAQQARKGMVEEAAGGTLFLDEIGDLSPGSQVKLLRLLQEEEYLPLGADRPRRSNVRIVAATNLDLAERMAAGAFRKDLYYRLKAHHVTLPSLRERRDDLPLLLEKFLSEAAEALGKKRPLLPVGLSDLMGDYPFPGNVRELRSMVFDAVSQHQSGRLSLAPFRKAIGEQALPSGAAPSSPLPADTGGRKLIFTETLPTLDEAGGLLVREAMERAGGNQSVAASFLGISRPALCQRLKKMRG
ncbi:two-component sigma54-specific transcriptional regulator, Fis family [Desulfuromonas soudanensis]|uniref:Two-component sigma54-specific transcriptional regulator, Fis family n=1 Tax=Desulfuromonas soudanensis TaxID=1603606 RepID=A0A0M4CZC2_9BACT|nr:sigma-54 dependent transcriptional regulator [Desulfuromonas soudanensis]ALC15840.1 two-component sigma54-specific transcriptional regulator, Fis family [Desulfuromonas soudanensis]